MYSSKINADLEGTYPLIVKDTKLMYLEICTCTTGQPFSLGIYINFKSLVTVIVNFVYVFFLFLGFISQQGLTHDPVSSSVGQLQRVFIALLNKSDKISFPVQLAAVDSLLELCPPANPRMQELVGVIKAWLKRQSGKPHGAVLCNEFGPRLQALTTT